METMISFQDIMRRLSRFWEENGCIIHQGYDVEVGAGTMNPATFLRCLGPEPYRAAYVEPCRRPADGRYGENPNRLQHYFQFQVILKPSPLNMQDLYLDSLKAIGIDLNQHDIRFVHDDWENPSIGAWGLGWEVWMDGMEITQYTYFQSVGGIPQKPVTGELTYGLERLAMYLQGVDNVYDVQWNGHLTYGNLYHRQEVEWSTYNFEKATTSMWFDHFDAYEKEAMQLLLYNLPLPAYEFVMKASHAFNILDARGAISVTERTGYIARMRDLAKHIADNYLESREKAGFPLMGRFPASKPKPVSIPPIAETLLRPFQKTDAFLLEIGSEELPATFVPIGMRNLEKEMKRLLREENIPYRSLKVYGTPRRLAVLVEELATALPEQVKERRGPTLDKAYDAQGQLTPAGHGFFRSLKKEPLSRDALEKGTDPDVTVKHPYIVGTVHLPAVPTADILAQKLPSLILNIRFPKTMRWAEETIIYARPLRWICALFGNETVPFAVGNVVSENTSSGHRQLDNGQQFPISSAENYVQLLRQYHVMVDPEERTKTILDALHAWETATHFRVHTEALNEVVHLVEWPQTMEATFASTFLKAPKEVLISEMVTHQKYFPVKGEDGALVPRFLIVADTAPTEKICHGNQKVLSSRLADGVFLYEKELHTPLKDFLEKLKHVTYLTGFGSLYDKVERLKKHASTLQTLLGISTQAQTMRAAEWSKADLATEMVDEFPELQGTIGKYYALAQGEENAIAQAIEEHWMPRGEDSPLPKTETGKLLSLAEKIDNLISCFAAGLQPTSSSDPYALRRQVLGMIKILIEGKYRLPFQETLVQCASHFAALENPQSVLKEIEAFFIQRMKTVFQDYGLYQDEVEASVAHGFTDIYDSFCKINALHTFRASDQKFVHLYEVYKRAKGQLNQEERRNHFSPALLCEEAEKQLDAALTDIEEKMYQALKGHHYNQAYQLIAEMQPYLAKLFDEVRILADDMPLRHNRIALLQRVFALFSQLLDFSKISEQKQSS